MHASKKFLFVALAVLLLAVGLGSALASDPLSFNRLMAAPETRNAAPPESGIHDPDNEGTHVLQSPRDVFPALPRSNSGNYVDWVQAMDDGKLNPRAHVDDASKMPTVMDLDIIREVRGSMPDVLFPHRQHTELLDCSACHPAIFVPARGSNDMSMAAIMMGEQCGVCHGRVAFPVSDCRACHSQPKSARSVAQP